MLRRRKSCGCPGGFTPIARSIGCPRGAPSKMRMASGGERSDGTMWDAGRARDRPFGAYLRREIQLRRARRTLGLRSGSRYTKGGGLIDSLTLQARAPRKRAGRVQKQQNKKRQRN